MAVPLPVDDTPWPPQPYAELERDIAEADVWYSGDADKLSAFYGGQRKRGFWTRRRVPTGPQPKRVHVPAAAAIASASADLLFGETPTFEVADQATQAHLEDLIGKVNLDATLLEGAETASGLGGVYLRPLWDDQVADHALLTVMHPDTAVPEFRWGRLVAVTFWTQLPGGDNGEVWRHLERYEPGLILHGLYQGTKDKLGHRRSLKDRAETAGLAGDDGTGAVNLEALGIAGMAARYVPNVRPNRKRRRHPIGRWMGRSDTAGWENIMDALDQDWSSLSRELDLAKARIIVPDQYLRRAGRGSGAEFDMDQEVFSPVKVGMDAEKLMIELVQPELRTSAHLESAAAHFEQLVAGSGYNAQTMGNGDQAGGQQTATEVSSKESLSERTTKKKRSYWAPELEATLEVMLQVERAVFGRSVVQPARPTLEWPQGEQDLRETASSLNLLNLAGAVSTETKVAIAHPDWDKKAVVDEAAMIRSEQGLGTESPQGVPLP